MQIRVTQKADMGLSLLAMRDAAERREVMQGIGLQLVSLAKRSFQEPALRPSDWPARLSGGDHALLKKRGDLWRSLRVTATTSNSVTCGSDRKYAGIHQHGGTIRAKTSGGLRFKIGDRWVTKAKVEIPARPFFPITATGSLTDLAKGKIDRLIHDWLEDAR